MLTTRPKSRAHAGQDEPGGVERRREVHCQGPVPVLRLEILERREVTDNGVVDHDVDRAEALLRRLDEGSDLTGVREVGAVMQRPHAVLFLELAPLALDLLGIAEAVQHNIAPFGGETFRHRVAQALGRAGDERGFAFQHVRCFPAGEFRSQGRS